MSRLCRARANSACSHLCCLAVLLRRRIKSFSLACNGHVLRLFAQLHLSNIRTPDPVTNGRLKEQLARSQGELKNSMHLSVATD